MLFEAQSFQFAVDKVTKQQIKKSILILDFFYAVLEEAK
jgi:hypothetical protein